jgi:hypothetical protein
MGFIRGFEHDIYISYSRRDNENIPESRKGWVDTFHDHLRLMLERLLGESPDIWRDVNRPDERPDVLSDETHYHLSKSALLITVLSPSYLRSDYCRREFSTFYLREKHLVDGYSRIFEVAKTYVPWGERPPMMGDSLSYEFYEYNEATRRLEEFAPGSNRAHYNSYLEILDDLAWDVRSLLARMAKHASEQPARATPPVKRNRVFVSYSHKDNRWLERLQVHLKPLENLGALERWDDTLIEPGDRWREEIRRALELARVAVLIISADFLASDFIMKDELPPMLTAAEKGGATILPLIASSCRFEETESLSQFQAVNHPSKPLDAMRKPKREEVFVKLVRLIENALRS